MVKGSNWLWPTLVESCFSLFQVNPIEQFVLNNGFCILSDGLSQGTTEELKLLS